MIRTTTRPRRIEAVQYDGVYDGDAHKMIAAALVRWFGRDGEENDDDARSYLGAGIVGDCRWPIVHVTEIDYEADCWVYAGSWVVYDVDTHDLSVWTDPKFRARTAPADSDADRLALAQECAAAVATTKERT